MSPCAKGLPLERARVRLPTFLGVLRTSRRFPLLAFPFTAMLGYDFPILRGVQCVTTGKTFSPRETDTVAAVRFDGRPDAEGFPTIAAWENAPAIRFSQDWQGKNSDPELDTEVRALWTAQTLSFKFLVRYRRITVFSDAEASGRRDQLWDRDVAEVFLQPPALSGRHYKEFEVSPNGFWIDLDIAAGEKHDLQSGLRRRAKIDEKSKTWMAELSLPMKSLTASFDPSATWRVNFYRVEGASEPRFYSAWRPTGTPVPNFHVPESFGRLVFET